MLTSTYYKTGTILSWPHIEAQRDAVTCPNLHNRWVWNLGKSNHRTYTLNNYTQSNHYKKSWCFNEKHCVFQFRSKHCRLSTWFGRLLKRLASIKSSRGAKVVRKGMFKKRWSVYWFGIKSYWGNGKRGLKFLKSSQITQRYHVSSPIKTLLVRKI